MGARVEAGSTAKGRIDMSASTNRVVRESQVKQVEVRVESRLAALNERGIDETARAKDPLLKNLKAQLTKARGRIKSMEASAAHVTKIAEERKAAKEKKAEKAAKAATKAKGAAKPKGDKKAKGAQAGNKKAKK